MGPWACIRWATAAHFRGSLEGRLIPETELEKFHLLLPEMSKEVFHLPGDQGEKAHRRNRNSGRMTCMRYECVPVLGVCLRLRNQKRSCIM